VWGGRVCSSSTLTTGFPYAYICVSVCVYEYVYVSVFVCVCMCVSLSLSVSFSVSVCGVVCESTAQTQAEPVPYVAAVYSLSDLVVRRVMSPLLLSDTIFALTPHAARWRNDIRALIGPSGARGRVDLSLSLSLCVCTCTYVCMCVSASFFLLLSLHVASSRVDAHIAYAHTGFVHDAIRQRRALLEAQGERTSDPSFKPAFLDLMLTATDSSGAPLSDDDIEEETSTFMFEGHGACIHRHFCVRMCARVC
jgi:hypothetical protein